jgi:D-beta-D-heptose 7-phosphate kinase/D-beta-D-heptose 1-phosphate adenosyltransferase
MEVRDRSFDGARVLVVGDVMLDRSWHGRTGRISPEAPVPVVLIDRVEARPGGAGNVALNVTSLGSEATVVGLIGPDEAGAELQTLLTRAGVRCELQRRDGFTTITKLRVLSRHQQLIRLDFEADSFHDPSGALLERFRAELPRADVVVMSDYGKGTLDASRELIDLARGAGKAVLVDPKSPDFGRYRGASIVTPNLAEFEAVAGTCPSLDKLVESARAILGRYELEALLITRGEEGMTLVRSDYEATHLPALAREVYDISGAGDTVIAVLGAALAGGLELQRATVLANLAAGLVVAKLGAASVTVQELRRELRNRENRPHGIVDEERLLELIRDARAHGERIVMTNGCFDLLHAGHVYYLDQARRLGDRLIVAVNDDASVGRLKGIGRPINPLEQRMHVLTALASVDWVIPFSEDTPEHLICRLGPEVLVKGGDYRAEDVAGYRCVRDAGGEVIVLDYRDGCSTSRIIERIAQTGND